MEDPEKDVLGHVSTELKRIEASAVDTNTKLKEVVERQEREIKELGGTTVTTRKELEVLEKRYDQEVSDITGIVGKLSEDFGEYKQMLVDAEKKAKDRRWETGGGFKDLGKSFTEADGWDHFNPNSGRNSPKVMIGSIDDYDVGVKSGRQRKYNDAVSSTGGVLDNVFGRTEWAGIYGLPFNDNLRLRDYMNVERATGNSVVYVERTAYNNGAEFQTAPGALKADSNMTFAEREAKADVLAHTADITRQQARQTPFIVNYVREQLLEGLYHVETRKILFSDGTSPGDFTGIFNHDRVLSYNGGFPANSTAIDVLRRSENQLGDNYLVGDLYVLNHRDWTEIELLKDNENRYIWVNVQDGGTPRMWRKPVLTTRAMPEGSFVNGCFRTCATLLDFQQAAVQIFDQYSDYPKRNLVMILAEEYIGLAITCPQGFVIGNLDGSAIASGS